ncbi:MAG: AAA family ATPase [Moorella sp. (in: Bacteria)]|nr:AAA family ATPase [Moorella sp. (in: firmicutes)]
MQGLKPQELKDYCLSRLKLAGLHEDIFPPPALEAIYGITNGLPRLVNNLVTTCMLCACSKKQRLIDEEIVYQAQRELEI